MCPAPARRSLAKAIAGSIAGTWKRVQFTPDLLPSDITGVMVFDQRTGTFSFREGPVFTNVLIGDEINRASPKTQSALLEVMEERQVTADGVAAPRSTSVLRHRHPEPPRLPGHLPAARRPARPLRHAADARLRRRRHRGRRCSRTTAVTARTTTSSPRHRRHRTRPADQRDRPDRSGRTGSTTTSCALANATRAHPDLRLGVSTRGTLTLLRVARAFAATEQRDYVTPDDIKTLVEPVFAHRMALTAEAELRGVRSRAACWPTSSTTSQYPVTARAEPC